MAFLKPLVRRVYSARRSRPVAAGVIDTELSHRRRPLLGGYRRRRVLTNEVMDSHDFWLGKLVDESLLPKGVECRQNSQRGILFEKEGNGWYLLRGLFSSWFRRSCYSGFDIESQPYGKNELGFGDGLIQQNLTVTLTSDT